MTKKFLLGLMSVIMLFAASCTNEVESLNNEGKTATVSFQVSTPDMATRSFGDGSTAKKMQYAVYIVNKDGTSTLLGDLGGEKTLTDNKTSVELQLVTGLRYQTIFWAAAEDAPYTFSPADRTVTVNYENAISNDENRDAFYYYEDFTVTSTEAKSAKLKRPFAQLNIGTSDLQSAQKAGLNVTHSSVKVSGLYSTLNLATGVVNGYPCVQTFGYAAIPNSDTETFPVNDYKYLAMNYLLVGEVAENGDKALVDVTLGYAEKDADGNTVNEFSRTVNSVPVQRNYRTNIYGKLLTSTTDIKVEINKDFDDVENVEIWDGKSISEPAFNETTKTYSISKPNELAWLAAAVSGTLGEARTSIPAKSFAGETFKLENDIDLGGCEWKPIGMGGKHFEGTFDGQGHTIKDFKITKHHGGDQAALFCSAAGNAVFKNFIIDEANIKYPENFNDDYYAAAVVGTIYGSLTFENITVKNSSITGNNKVAGLIAHDGSSTQFTINNCHIDNCYIASENLEDGGCVGGMIGYYATGVENKPNTISNSSVKNCVIVGVNSSNSGKRANSEFIGSIKTQDNMVLNIEYCVVENNNFSQTTNGTDVVTYVGSFDPQFIGGDREEAHKGTININGYEVVANGVNLKNEEYFIYNANGLKWLADEVNKFSNYEYPFKDKVIYLTQDIDLGGIEWTPIGDYRFSANRFCGTFDGQDHTISNFQITKKTDKNDSNKSSYGFFGNVEGTIKNLTVANATVNSYAYTGALVGRFNSGLIENCHVVNCTISNTFWQGGILIGQVNASNGINSIVRNCTVSESSITSKSAIGAIAGPVTIEADTEGIFENCLVRNCQVIQEGSFGSSYDNYFGSMFGYLEAGDNACIKVVNCKTEKTTVKGESNAPISGDFDGTIYVDGSIAFSSAASFTGLVDNMTVIIVSNIEGETIKLPANLKNVTIKAAKGVILKSTTISAADGNSYNYEGLTFNGITFDNSRIVFTGWRNGEEVLRDLTITNCVFQNLDDNTNTAPVHINKDAAEAVQNFTFTNNVIDGATGGSKSGVYAQLTGSITFKDNVINNVSFRPYVIQVTTDDGIADNFEVTGNTFSGSAVGRAQGLGNNAEGTDDVIFVVSGNIFKGITDAQQICYWNFNAATTTANLSRNYYDIDIEANPSRIYYNAAASSVEDLKAMGVYPFYTELNADGTINVNSLKEAE